VTDDTAAEADAQMPVTQEVDAVANVRRDLMNKFRRWPRACHQLSKTAEAVIWTPARKFLAVLS
jgi:hypothetical protein